MPSCEMFNTSFCMISLLGCSTLYPGKITIFQEIGLYLLTLSIADTVCFGFLFLELDILFQTFYGLENMFLVQHIRLLNFTCLDFQGPAIQSSMQNEEFLSKIKSLSRSQV